MDVPEPRTVIFSGAGGMVKALEPIFTRSRVRPPGVFYGRALTLAFAASAANPCFISRKVIFRLPHEATRKLASSPSEGTLYVSCLRCHTACKSADASVGSPLHQSQ